MLKQILCFIPSTIVALAVCFATPVSAQTREAPYWATIKPDELNMRVGPSTEYKIDWVYRRAGLPIKVVRLAGGWRLIQDVDGAQGWVLSSFLSPRRSALVIGKGLAAIRATPNDGGTLKWNAEPGVVGYLGDCTSGWCEFDVGGREGWVREDRLWGTGEP